MAEAKHIQHRILCAGIRQRLLSGLLLLVPFLVTVTVMVWLFAWIRRLLRPVLTRLFSAVENWPRFRHLPADHIRLIASGAAILLLLFVPTAPSPVTGFLVLQPQQNVIHTDMSVDEAFKMIMSGGLISRQHLPLTSTVNTFPAEENADNAD